MKKEKTKKMKIIGIIAKKEKEKIFIPCHTSRLWIEYNGSKFEISDMNKL